MLKSSIAIQLLLMFAKGCIEILNLVDYAIKRHQQEHVFLNAVYIIPENRVAYSE